MRFTAFHSSDLGLWLSMSSTGLRIPLGLLAVLELLGGSFWKVLFLLVLLKVIFYVGISFRDYFFSWPLKQIQVLETLCLFFGRAMFDDF